MQNRIFIIASERSGTNLLRTLLGNHKNIHAPIAPHFLSFFVPILKYYAPLSKEENIKRLINDFLANANHIFNDWQLNISTEQFYQKYHPISFLDIFDSIYKEKTLQASKQSYCSKGIHTFDYVSLLKDKFPNAKFIYLYRDPRDHTSSWINTPLFMHTSYQIIQKWNKEQNKCLTLTSLYPNDIYSLSYESLIKDSSLMMTNILNFLNEEVDIKCFRTNSNVIESKRNELWQNLSRPIMTKNFKKYKKKLSKKDILIIESIAKDNMKLLGYNDFETKANWNAQSNVLFQFHEKVKKMISRRKNKAFYSTKMKDLDSKIKLQKEIKNNIKAKRTQI